MHHLNRDYSKRTFFLRQGIKGKIKGVDRLRKSPKERRNQYVQAQRITTAEAAIAVKAPSALTFSATHPAYTYTSLCSDQRLREPPVKKGEVNHGI